MGFKKFYTMKISLNKISCQISIYHKKKVFLYFSFLPRISILQIGFYVFDTSGPHSLCGDCGGLHLKWLLDLHYKQIKDAKGGTKTKVN